MLSSTSWTVRLRKNRLPSLPPEPYEAGHLRTRDRRAVSGIEGFEDADRVIRFAVRQSSQGGAGVGLIHDRVAGIQMVPGQVNRVRRQVDDRRR